MLALVLSDSVMDVLISEGPGESGGSVKASS